MQSHSSLDPRPAKLAFALHVCCTAARGAPYLGFKRHIVHLHGAFRLETPDRPSPQQRRCAAVSKEWYIAELGASVANDASRGLC